jgi:hypothetical protein
MGAATPIREELQIPRSHFAPSSDLVSGHFFYCRFATSILTALPVQERARLPLQMDERPVSGPAPYPIHNGAVKEVWNDRNGHQPELSGAQAWWVGSGSGSALSDLNEDPSVKQMILHVGLRAKRKKDGRAGPRAVDATNSNSGLAEAVAARD